MYTMNTKNKKLKNECELFELCFRKITYTCTYTDDTTFKKLYISMHLGGQKSNPIIIRGKNVQNKKLTIIINTIRTLILDNEHKYSKQNV